MIHKNWFDFIRTSFNQVLQRIDNIFKEFFKRFRFVHRHNLQFDTNKKTNQKCELKKKWIDWP